MKLDPVKATRPAKTKATATKTTTTMRRTATRKTATRKPATKKSGGNTIKKAVTILAKQKADWQKIFRSEVKKKNVNSNEAAKMAGSIYRSKYGRTPSARWKNAISKAKR